jgi:hypothetical protein
VHSEHLTSQHKRVYREQSANPEALLPVCPLTYNNPARPRREHLQQRTCRQALYQACLPPSSAQEKRARGRSICGSAGAFRGSRRELSPRESVSLRTCTRRTGNRAAAWILRRRRTMENRAIDWHNGPNPVSVSSGATYAMFPSHGTAQHPENLS